MTDSSEQCRKVVIKGYQYNYGYEKHDRHYPRCRSGEINREGISGPTSGDEETGIFRIVVEEQELPMLRIRIAIAGYRTNEQIRPTHIIA